MFSFRFCFYLSFLTFLLCFLRGHMFTIMTVADNPHTSIAPKERQLIMLHIYTFGCGLKKKNEKKVRTSDQSRPHSLKPMSLESLRPLAQTNGLPPRGQAWSEFLSGYLRCLPGLRDNQNLMESACGVR